MIHSLQRLLDAEGIELEVSYTEMLVGLGQLPGTLGTIFRKAQNRIQDPAKLKRLIVDLIDQENWSAAGTDLKGDAYEELLSKGASDKGSGAGQYFTPRDLIQAIVEVIDPGPGDTVVDPACGTGGFLLVAHDHAAQNAQSLTPDERAHLRDDFATGYELVDGTARLAAMNLLLHGIGAADSDSLIHVRDALIADPGHRYSIVLSNPPFGTSSSVPVERQDFVVTTSNKQLNFIQHIMTILDINGRAAVVLPDNVLFEGGAGETLRRKLLASFDLHTMLRLPTGIFYAQGVKANVLFFDKKPAAENPWTSTLWVYDLRTNQRFTPKQNPLRRHHLEEFVSGYLPGKDRTERIEGPRWKSYPYTELLARDKINLDLTWLRDESLEDLDNLPDPHIIAREIIQDLTAALTAFQAITTTLENGVDTG